MPYQTEAAEPTPWCKKTKAAQYGPADEAPTPEMKASDLLHELLLQYFLVCSSKSSVLFSFTIACLSFLA